MLSPLVKSLQGRLERAEEQYVVFSTSQRACYAGPQRLSPGPFSLRRPRPPCRFSLANLEVYCATPRRIRRAREREKGLRERLEGDDISHLLAAQRAQAESLRCALVPFGAFSRPRDSGSSLLLARA